MSKVKKNEWLLEGITNETATMIKVWDLLMDQCASYDVATMCRWKSSFEEILLTMSKQCDEMEEELSGLNPDAYYELMLPLSD